MKDLKNWRPISLLNVDYKIISKVITLRLSHVMASIVHPDQTCSVLGRSIASNVTMLCDVLDYINRTNESGILVSLDQEKAFDRVNHSFLFKLLSHLGFGSCFIKWVSTLYKGANVKIILNGYLTEQIEINRGVRQGDPLSPLLYVLCVEVLASLIRSSSFITGFLLPGAKGVHFRVRQYADDTTTFVKNISSLTQLFNVISLYEKGSGAKLNRSKTEAMWLGAWRSREDQPLGLTWVRKMKILGVWFGVVPVEEDTWLPRINKLEKAIKFLSRSVFIVRRKPLMVRHPSRRVTFVNVYDAPHELPDSAIEVRLAKFGTILSVRRGKCQEFPDVFNGVRHVRMLLDHAIPCYLRFGRFQVRVKYEA